MQKNDFNFRMKKILFPVLILVCNIALSQAVIPETYSKIKFVYEQQSNFLIENGNLYADTLLFRISFPKLKFSTVISPIDSTKTIGFIAMKNLNKEDKRTLGSSLYHTTHIITGIYDVKKNKTKLLFRRGSPALTEIFKKYFGGDSSPFVFDVIIDYKNDAIYTNYPSVNYSSSIKSKLKKIIFASTDKSVGTCTFLTHRNDFQTDVVTLNNKYSKKITSDEVFSNNDYAIDKIVSLYDTTTLLSVIYEQ
jgi:hypothetical protein